MNNGLFNLSGIGTSKGSYAGYWEIKKMRQNYLPHYEKRKVIYVL
jgi:hypothetical protein